MYLSAGYVLVFVCVCAGIEILYKELVHYTLLSWFRSPLFVDVGETHYNPTKT